MAIYAEWGLDDITIIIIFLLLPLDLSFAATKVAAAATAPPPMHFGLAFYKLSKKVDLEKGKKHQFFIKKCLAHSYAVQEMAVAGILATILGFKPRQNPFQP